MRKFAALATVSAVALAGIVFAAAGGGKSTGSGAVLLPASSSPAVAVSARPTAAAVAGSAIPDSWICVFKKGSVAAGAEQAEANKVTGKAGGRIGHVYRYALQGFSINLPAQGAKAVAAHNPNIEYCEADQVATAIDPINALAKPGGGGGSTTESTPAGITRVGGGANYTGTGRAFVIDSGIFLTHPDLNVDTALSRNFVSRETSPNDLNGHGTHVAGTIAAKLNGTGVVGVAAGAKVVAVRVLDRRGSGAYSDVIAGVDYVASVGSAGDVANMSLGGPVSDALDTAVVNASNSSKVIFALAAGNETDDANNHSPARADGPYIYTVAAVNSSDTFASFSNYSLVNDPVDFAEPGVSILSTWLNGGYNTISGTSMATPHLAGLVLIGGPRSDGRLSSAAPNGVRFPVGVK
ncbi:peptidase S8 [Novosphingobium sp. THN1]|uniref:S8 family serine peptidase n=1 Tax=Novosphingobium sp. THN1 TaxID=1016987 RepID=UPI000E530E33|nr:S8 family serine peptidase [Novosphingobium sp. THN1]AXU18175.1 peptidase S8 [Novosphingobium sp. THN1]